MIICKDRDTFIKLLFIAAGVLLTADRVAHWLSLDQTLVPTRMRSLPNSFGSTSLCSLHGFVHSFSSIITTISWIHSNRLISTAVAASRRRACVLNNMQQ